MSELRIVSEETPETMWKDELDKILEELEVSSLTKKSHKCLLSFTENGAQR